MKILSRVQFGNPVLREVAQKVPTQDISSKGVQSLIADMRHTLLEKKLGIGLAAPQVGKRLAIAVIAIRPREYRPNTEPFDLVMINPEITDYIGRKVQLWEGCISAGSHGRCDLFAKVPRYPEVKVKYWDETGQMHHATFESLKAQLIQHEVDHLNGILFVDRVKDPTTYMTFREYIKLIKQNKA